MASETPPPAPSSGDYPLPADYEFDPAEDLAPSNEFLDDVLTRAGELALDTIEAVQEHPVMAASLAAAGVGMVVGLVAAGLVPRRRSTVDLILEAPPPAPPPPVAALRDLPGRLSSTGGRLGEAAGAAGQGLRGSWLFNPPPLRRGGRPAPDASARGEAALHALGLDGATLDPSSTARRAMDRGRYVAQLVPLTLALLRNPIVRDLLAQAVAGRLRRRATL